MEFINHVEGLVSAQLQIVRRIWTMVKLEARLAKLSIFPVILNLFLLLLIFLSFWLSSMALLGYLLAVYFSSILISLVIVFVLNLGFLVLLGIALMSNLKKMSFVNTRKYLANRHKRSKNNEIKKSTG